MTARGLTRNAIVALSLAFGFAIGVGVMIAESQWLQAVERARSAQNIDACLRSYAACLEKCP